MPKPSSEALLDQALTGPDRETRRQAFLDLVASGDWKLALAPQVISLQGYALRDGFFPDLITFQQAAPLIAALEERVQRVLELLGAKFCEELSLALARHMGEALVEHALPHLRTAVGERGMMLQNLLQQADPDWVLLPEAKRVLRQRLRQPDRGRVSLMGWMAAAGNIGEFVEEIREHPPTGMEEWSALGRGGVRDEGLINHALATLGAGPDALAYLLRLDPVPEMVGPRLMAAARPDWIIHGLEVAIITGLHHPLIIPLAELGVRLGGRPMAAAMAWLGSARLGKKLLRLLSELIVREGDRASIKDILWVQRRSPSSNRAMEDGRKGVVPSSMDAAALVRQLRGEKVTELVHEILGQPRPSMMDAVLRPLCAVSLEAAGEVVALCKSPDLDISRRAREARDWPDVAWPEELVFEIE